MLENQFLVDSVPIHYKLNSYFGSCDKVSEFTIMTSNIWWFQVMTFKEVGNEYATCVNSDWLFFKLWHVFRVMVNTVGFTGLYDFNDNKNVG